MRTRFREDHDIGPAGGEPAVGGVGLERFGVVAHDAGAKKAGESAGEVFGRSGHLVVSPEEIVELVADVLGTVFDLVPDVLGLAFHAAVVVMFLLVAIVVGATGQSSEGGNKKQSH
jgi:hypothetical protein